MDYQFRAWSETFRGGVSHPSGSRIAERSANSAFPCRHYKCMESFDGTKRKVQNRQDHEKRPHKCLGMDAVFHRKVCTVCPSTWVSLNRSDSPSVSVIQYSGPPSTPVHVQSSLSSVSSSSATPSSPFTGARTAHNARTGEFSFDTPCSDVEVALKDKILENILEFYHEIDGQNVLKRALFGRLFRDRPKGSREFLVTRGLPNNFIRRSYKEDLELKDFDPETAAKRSPLFAYRYSVLYTAVKPPQSSTPFHPHFLGKATASFWAEIAYEDPCHRVKVLRGGDATVPLYHIYGTKKSFFSQYRQFWAENALRILTSAQFSEEASLQRSFKEKFKVAPDPDTRFEFLLQHRLAFAKPETLYNTIPFNYRVGSILDFNCPICRRSAEAHRTLRQRMAAAHSKCGNCDKMNVDCENVRNIIEQESEMTPAEFEEQFGKARLIDLVAASQFHADHIEQVRRQRGQGFRGMREDLCKRKKACVLVADFTPFSRLFRRSDGGRTMSEQRSSQYGWLGWAVIWNDGNTEHIEYHDFSDEWKRDSPEVVAYCLNILLKRLCQSGFRDFHVWSDTCSNQFRSRIALHSVLIDLVDALHREDISIQSMAWSFFIAYHGKCLCNGHFSAVKRAIQVEADERGYVAGIEDIVDVISRKVEHTRTTIVPKEIGEIRRDSLREIPAIKKHHTFIRKIGCATLICKPFIDSSEAESFEHSYTPYLEGPKRKRKEFETERIDSQAEEGDVDEAEEWQNTASSLIRDVRDLTSRLFDFLGAPYAHGLISKEMIV